jgi:hypothetical protein
MTEELCEGGRAPGDGEDADYAERKPRVCDLLSVKMVGEGESSRAVIVVELNVVLLCDVIDCAKRYEPTALQSTQREQGVRVGVKCCMELEEEDR